MRLLKECSHLYRSWCFFLPQELSGLFFKRRRKRMKADYRKGEGQGKRKRRNKQPPRSCLCWGSDASAVKATFQWEERLIAKQKTAMGNRGEKAHWSPIREGPECQGRAFTVSPPGRRNSVPFTWQRKANASYQTLKWPAFCTKRMAGIIHNEL